ncbi:probable glutamate--tRNA ligase, mitochondrial [Patiria miniata]|uniref:Nondiscriminating glutamyl-tRNA synthetase EARS2, mitochondrial n=1 Tax=Patiria miniata TaxID=46514 RepID=A0A914B385_PATMI|nr:probable glutamate--tRNA ligase, mitochondrial [Patiria miniata]XP_038070785.1 probable glutamate--tRNA ligase, mitochondrial [Patiria miniata]
MGFLRQSILRVIRPLSTSSICRCEVRVRFAPSPTGHIHLGGLRTALYNYIFAKAHRGTFILRIEDTDQTRLVPGAEDHLQEMLAWSGVNPDEGPVQGGSFGPYKQSERLHIYKEHMETLVKTGAAYHCFCTEQRLELLRKEAMRNRQVPRYDNRCRHLSHHQVQDHLRSGKPSVLRLKLEPNIESFEDLVYGKTSHDVGVIEGDPVLIKSDGFPTYHFANVVDDHLMGITHVLRGMEWLTSTPKHLYLYKAFAWSPPKFAHLPLLLNRDGSKLSKRQGDIFVQHFKDAGFLPEAVVNFITFCGSGFEENKTIRSMQQLIQEFSLHRVSTHSAVLEMRLLPEVNRGHIIRLLTHTEGRHRLVALLRQQVAELLTRSEGNNKMENLTDEYLLRVLEARKHHIDKIQDLCQPDYIYLWIPPRLSKGELMSVSSQAELVLDRACKEIDSLQEKVLSEVTDLSPKLRQCSESLAGIPYSIFMRVLRIALSNVKKGASVAEMMSVLGKTETLHRLHAAHEIVRQNETHSR